MNDFETGLKEGDVVELDDLRKAGWEVFGIEGHNDVCIEFPGDKAQRFMVSRDMTCHYAICNPLHSMHRPVTYSRRLVNRAGDELIEWGRLLKKFAEEFL